jgi:hypothetical protein
MALNEADPKDYFQFQVLQGHDFITNQLKHKLKTRY